ncbi:MAG: hypothetical protein WC744_02420 [Patescibacteria group bacterium]|jgi:hypothetical protein
MKLPFGLNLTIFNKGKSNETFLVGSTTPWGSLNHDKPEARIRKNTLVTLAAVSTFLCCGGGAALLYLATR